MYDHRGELCFAGDYPVRHYPLNHLRRVEQSRRGYWLPLAPGPLWSFDVVGIAAQHRDLCFYAEAWYSWFRDKKWQDCGYDSMFAWKETRTHLLLAKKWHSTGNKEAIDRIVFLHNQSDHQYKQPYHPGHPNRKPFYEFDVTPWDVENREDLVALLTEGI